MNSLKALEFIMEPVPVINEMIVPLEECHGKHFNGLLNFIFAFFLFPFIEDLQIVDSGSSCVLS